MKQMKLLAFVPVLYMFTSASFAHATEATGPTPAPTRQEVRDDLAAWQKASLAEVWRQEPTPDTFSADYQEKYATYLRLRGAQANTVRR